MYFQSVTPRLWSENFTTVLPSCNYHTNREKDKRMVAIVAMYGVSMEASSENIPTTNMERE